MADRPTPAQVIDDWVDTTDHTAGILAALGDAGYVVVEQEHEARLVDAVQSIAYFMEQRDQATDQRDRAVRALAALTHGNPKGFTDALLAGTALVNEPWAQAVLDGDWKPWQHVGDPE